MLSSMLEALIFDVDGTLADTERDGHRPAFNAAFADCGAPPDHEDDPSAWGVLTSVLDDLVASGDLSPDLRQDAPLICWTSVHGLASLVSFGELPPVEDVGAATDAVVHGVQRSLGLR